MVVAEVLHVPARDYPAILGSCQPHLASIPIPPIQDLKQDRALHIQSVDDAGRSKQVASERNSVPKARFPHSQFK